MKFFKTISVLTIAAASVVAYDLRELWAFPGGDGVAFCTAWTSDWFVFGYIVTLLHALIVVCFAKRELYSRRPFTSISL
jgi:hypothetical protein